MWSTYNETLVKIVLLHSIEQIVFKSDIALLFNMFNFLGVISDCHCKFKKVKKNDRISITFANDVRWQIKSLKITYFW